VWWIWNNSGGGPNGIFRANADGTGFAAFDANRNDYLWWGIAVDDEAVYCSHDGAVVKKLK
jgi:hypothetical protein